MGDTDQPGGDDATEVVAAVTGSLHQREFLIEASPIAGDEVGPEVIGVPRQRLSQRGQSAVAVLEDPPAVIRSTRLPPSPSQSGRCGVGAGRSPTAMRPGHRWWGRRRSGLERPDQKVRGSAGRHRSSAPLLPGRRRPAPVRQVRMTWSRGPQCDPGHHRRVPEHVGSASRAGPPPRPPQRRLVEQRRHHVAPIRPRQRDPRLLRHVRGRRRHP